MTATEWIAEWLTEFPEDQFLIDRMRARGEADEEIKSFLEGI